MSDFAFDMMIKKLVVPPQTGIDGDEAQAIKNYKKSLKLDPNNRNAAEMIRKLKEKKEIAGA